MDQIDLIKLVVRRVIEEEPELIKEIIKDSLTIEVHHDSVRFGDEYKVTTEITVKLDGHSIDNTKDTFSFDAPQDFSDQGMRYDSEPGSF